MQSVWRVVLRLGTKCDAANPPVHPAGSVFTLWLRTRLQAAGFTKVAWGTWEVAGPSAMVCAALREALEACEDPQAHVQNVRPDMYVEYVWMHIDRMGPVAAPVDADDEDENV